MIGLFLFFKVKILKIALVLLVILSLIGLGYLLYISHKLLRRVQKQQILEKNQTELLPQDERKPSLNKKK
ncbi:hypothetical protein [Acinetobacter ihumii]|uniref:hypothetical protein n=1 Tax=Acinetobacter ihumii TaxID=2483802 RepID=UPI00102FE294|nr:hypothetical protein [Acinetobacter ihumii]